METYLGRYPRTLKDYVQAQKCYNQAFVKSMQMTMEVTKAMSQMTIKRKLAALDLQKK